MAVFFIYFYVFFDASSNMILEFQNGTKTIQTNKINFNGLLWRIYTGFYKTFFHLTKEAKQELCLNEIILNSNLVQKLPDQIKSILLI